MPAGSKLRPRSGATRAGRLVAAVVVSGSPKTVFVVPPSQPAPSPMPSAAPAPSTALISETAASEEGRIPRVTLAVRLVVLIANAHEACVLFEDERCNVRVTLLALVREVTHCHFHVTFQRPAASP